MITPKELKRNAEELSALKTMVKVYGEIAASRMNRVRNSVLFSRTFLDEIQKVFYEVQAAYVDQLKKFALDKKEKVTLLSHNGKNVAVFLSANTRLYGDLVQRTYEQFIEDVTVTRSEATIIGSVGLQLYKNDHPNKPYTYFELPDNGVDRKVLEKVVRHLVQYQEIHVYYGKYKNVITQTPTMFLISAEIGLEHREKKEVTHYIFEPSLEKVLEYFEKEIFGTLFEQTIAESQLAKFASRLVAMDRAEQNVTEQLSKMRITQLKAAHQISNRKQLNSMGSILMRF